MSKELLYFYGRMCGIFGILTKGDTRIQRKVLESAADLLAHRGPDMHDYYQEENLAFAHRRLSIFDTSEKAKQPLEAYGNIIVFNGAIYNYPELKEQLVAKGYTFKTSSDTELILAAYAEYGKDCVSQFNGQWAFAIYDKEKQIVFCSRDRFGIKPFYYIKNDNRFCFSSEIKAFSSLDNWQPRINSTRVFEFLEFAMHDHTKETMFEDVIQLGRAESMVIQLNDLSVEKKVFYSLTDKLEKEWKTEDAVRAVDTHLDTAINLRLRADVKSASALSGGLDSSIIALRIAEALDTPYDTFSVVYPDEEFNEQNYVDEVLKNSLLKGHVLSPSFEQFLENLDTLIWHQDEPFNGISVYAQYCLFETAAKQGVRVMLDGQGADEIFAGYEKFYLPVFKKLIKRNPIKAAKLFNAAKKNFPHINAKTNLINYLNSGKKKEQSCFHLEVDKTKLFKRAPEDSILAMSKNLLSGLGISALLRYEDRNAMAHGIESRVPYLDHNLVECALSLPDNMKINEGVSKWALRESSKELLPELIYKRKDKLGFATPEKKWLEEHFDDIKTRIYAKEEQLEKMVNLNMLFEERDLKKIFRVFVFSRWLSVFNLT